MAEETNNSIKMCIVGAQGSGKSALVFRFIEGKFRYEDHPTLEDHWEKDFIAEDKITYKISVLDTGGSEETYQNLYKNWFEESEGFIIVYNIASKFTFGKLWSFIRTIDKIKPNAPRIIVGTQSDKSKQREVTTKEGLKIAQQLGCDFVEASAKTGENVNLVFSQLLKKMKSPKEEPQHSIKPNREVSVAIQKISRNPSSPVLSRKRAGSALLPHHFSADATFDEDSWTTPKEPKRSWAELENPNSVNDLFKTDKAISQGFHFEFGKNGVPYINEVEIEDEAEDYAYYSLFFYGKDHLNLISETESGYIIISCDPPVKSSSRKVIIRTKKGNERLMVPASHSSSKKLILDYIKLIRPDIGDVKNFVKSDWEIQDDLLNYETKELASRERMKIGVLLHQDGQDENAMFSNSHTPTDMEEFLEFLATKIELKGFAGYSGGLDLKTNSTGTHSYFTQYHAVEIMFHVSTLLPFQESDTQRVERKRHLGNDIVLLIFQDGKEPFDPTIITSHFNHVFIIIQVVEKKEDGSVKYRIAIANKAGIDPYGPYLSEPAIYENNQEFRDFLLTKIINAERWCLKGGEFRATNIRTRKETLEKVVKEAENRPKQKKKPKDLSGGRIASPAPTRPSNEINSNVDPSLPSSPSSSFRMVPGTSAAQFIEKDKASRSRSQSSGSPIPNKIMKPSEVVMNVANAPREFSQEKIDKIISCARALANASQVEPIKFESSEFREKLYQLVSNTVATFTGTDKQLENIIELAKSLSETGSSIITLQEKRKNTELAENLEPAWKQTQSDFGNKLVTFIRAINSTVYVEPPEKPKEPSKEVIMKIEKPAEAIGKTTLEIASLLSKAEFDAEEFGKHMRLIYDAVKEIASSCEDPTTSRALLDEVKPLLQKAVQLKNESNNFSNRKVFIAELTKLCALLKDVKTKTTQ